MIEILFARQSDVVALQTGTVQSVINDTNVTGLVVGTVLTLGWQSTLAGARGGTGVNNGANTITLGGNISTASTLTTAGAVTFSGAFSTTLTATATTVSTLPAGTHTLAAIDLAQTWTATQNIPTIAGGAATNATLTLEGSSNGAPSNDIINVLGQTINLRATANSSTTSVNIGNANATGGILTIAGGTSGAQTYQPASVASGIITFPAGTVNFSATGGANQVVKQTSAGGIFTVGQVVFGEIGNQIQIGQFPTGPGIISNATLANMAAWTIKMNNTSGAAAPTDTTINALTTKATPVGADLVPIWDVAGAAMKNATITSMVGTGAVTSFNTATGAVSFIVMPQGRLTVTSNTPVMSASATAQGTLFYDQYVGNMVPYFNGSNDVMDTIAGGQVSTVMVSAASAGQVVASNVYDVWWVHSGANRICLAMSASAGGGGGWSSDTGGSNTVRGTGYSQLDFTTRPYITNKNSITNCFNAATNYGPVSANQATYLGTIFSTANGQTGMSFSATGAGGSTPTLGVYNAWNQVETNTYEADTTATWTYNTNTWRKANNSATNSIQYVDGLQRSPITATYVQLMNIPVTGQGLHVGVHLDWSSGVPQFTSSMDQGATDLIQGSVTVIGTFAPTLGFHVVNALEGTQSAAGAVTMYGTGWGAMVTQGSYLQARLMM